MAESLVTVSHALLEPVDDGLSHPGEGDQQMMSYRPR